MIMRKRLSRKRQRETRRKDRRKTNMQKRSGSKNLPGAFHQKKSRGSTSSPRLRSAPITDEWHRTVAPRHRTGRGHRRKKKGKEKPAGAKQERPEQPPGKPEPNPQKNPARRPQSPPERPSPQLRQEALKPPPRLHQQNVVSLEAQDSLARREAEKKSMEKLEKTKH